MLFGIKKISYCDSTALTCDHYSRVTGKCSWPTNDMTDICLSSQKLAKLKISSSVNGRVVMHSAELRFATEDGGALKTKSPKSFLVETVDGAIFVIGGNERPYAVMQEDYNVASNATDTSGTSYVVSYSSQYDILRVF